MLHANRRGFVMGLVATASLTAANAQAQTPATARRQCQGRGLGSSQAPPALGTLSDSGPLQAVLGGLPDLPGQ